MDTKAFHQNWVFRLPSTISTCLEIVDGYTCLEIVEGTHCLESFMAETQNHFLRSQQRRIMVILTMRKTLPRRCLGANYMSNLRYHEAFRTIRPQEEIIILLPVRDSCHAIFGFVTESMSSIAL